MSCKVSSDLLPNSYSKATSFPNVDVIIYPTRESLVHSNGLTPESAPVETTARDTSGQHRFIATSLNRPDEQRTSLTKIAAGAILLLRKL